MKLRQTNTLMGCLLVLAAGAVVVPGAAGGEPIRFSRPAVPIATEAKHESQLPAARDKRPDFGASSMHQPAAIPPMVVRTQPNEKEKKKNAGRHWLLNDPKDFPDATGRANAREKLANGRSRTSDAAKRNAGNSPRSDEESDLEETEKTGALSPISDFHWDAHRGESRSNSWSSTGRNNSEKNDSQNSNPFGAVFGRNESSEEKRDSSSSFFSSLIAARSKEEKPTEAQLEHRAAFQRLLNLDAVTSSRTGGSLEPVTAVENVKAVAPPATIPSLAPPRLDGRSLDPMNTFNQRQSELRGPMAVDFNKKPNNPVPPAPAAVGSASDSPFQTPLMRQPTVREIPTRKF